MEEMIKEGKRRREGGNREKLKRKKGKVWRGA